MQIETGFVRRLVIRATLGALLLITAACAAQEVQQADGRIARLLPDREVIGPTWLTNDRCTRGGRELEGNHS